jgi:pimeloyl-ACP methyl ester carboxylesterase
LASAAASAHDSPARPIESHLAAVESLRLGDGRGLCVRRWPGTGENTLVLLHGLLDSSEGWGCLGEGLTCARVAFDLPGFGYSDVSSPGSIDGYARDVAEGLQMLGIERFTLVGHSLGGAVATALAELMPAKVDAIVLLAPAGFGRLGLAEAVSTPGVRHIVEVALPLALSSRLVVTAAYLTMVSNRRAPGREVVDRVTSRGGALAAGAREGTRAVVEAGRSRQAFHRRRVDYDGPVDAVWGDCDRLVPLSHRDGVRAAFPHARVHVWRGMGHDPLRERLDEVTDLIARAVPAATPARRCDQTAAAPLATAIGS